MQPKGTFEQDQEKNHTYVYTYSPLTNVNNLPLTKPIQINLDVILCL